ncbi:MAG: FAD-dependent oxidoreductase [Pseudomonadales bacterium]|nr:FAD-dependent oxidoreductase [Pseudomonadales bacterium]
MAIVIIGAGQAAGQTAASLRQEGSDEEIIIIGEEPHVPYSRPILSKEYLAGHDGARVFLRAEKFYGDKNITMKTNQRAEKIDTAAKTVTIEGGEVVAYSKLLIATGSRARILNIKGSDLKGIFYLRTLDDVDQIKNAMAPGKKLVIVGGGYIGLEVASVAKTCGLDVTVLEAADRILQRVTTPEMSEFYDDLHSGHGVKLLKDTGVSGFEGTDTVTHVCCGDDKIEADMVIVGIGIIPNTELAVDAGIECDNGIVVDERCRTSVEDVYSAGDCANHPNPILGRRLRLESVPNAMDQARVVAANMMGKDKTYAAVPWFWSDQYDLKLQMVGFSADGDTQVVRGDKAANKFSVLYLKDGALVAVDAVNNPADFMAGKQLYGKKLNLDGITDAGIPLKDLVLPE